MRMSFIDILFLIGLILMAIPIYKYSIDLGLFITGVVIVSMTIIFQRKKKHLGDEKKEK